MKTEQDLNLELFNAVQRKDLDRSLEILNNPNFKKIKLIKEKYTEYNILHLSIFNFKLFKIIAKKNKKLLYLVDRKKESPLFPLIRRFKGDMLQIYPLIDNKQLNIISLNEENLLTLLINKKEIEIIKKILNKNIDLTDYNYYHLNRLGIPLPKKYYKKELESFFNKFKIGNFSKHYRNCLINLNIESFIKNPNKKIKKLFFEEVNKSKADFPHIKLQKMILLKDLNINQDILFNYLNKTHKSYGFLNDKEFKQSKDILKRISNKVSINMLFNLVDDLFFTDFKYIEYLLENLSFCSYPKKIKTWENFVSQVKKEIQFQRNKKHGHIDLNQGIKVLNNKKINDDLYFIVPDKQQDLINASFILNICVGNSLHYTQKIKDFESMIVFIYNKNNELKYCLELSTTKFFKIIQAKGSFNKECPNEIKENAQLVIDDIMNHYLNE